jgi:hypothetical protein
MPLASIFDPMWILLLTNAGTVGCASSSGRGDVDRPLVGSASDGAGDGFGLMLLLLAEDIFVHVRGKLNFVPAIGYFPLAIKQLAYGSLSRKDEDCNMNTRLWGCRVGSLWIGSSQVIQRASDEYS